MRPFAMSNRRPKKDLTGKQRTYLRGLGHVLEPLVQIGHQGLTEPVVTAVHDALDSHELIKVRVGKNAPEDRAELKTMIADRLGAHAVQSVGRVILLFRQAKAAEDRKVRLPKVGDPVAKDAAADKKKAKKPAPEAEPVAEAEVLTETEPQTNED